MALALKLPIMKKTEGSKAKKGEFGAKMRAWWNGTDYVPSDELETEQTEQAPAEKIEEQPKTKIADAPMPEEELNLEDSLREINAALGGEDVPATPKTEINIEPEAQPALSLVEKTQPHKIEKNENQAYIAACEILWGVGRLSPTTNELDEFLISQLLEEKRNNIAVFGNDLGARARIAALNFQKTTSFEKGRDFKKHIEGSLRELKNCKFQTYDDKPGSVPKNNADALFMAFCGTKIKDVESHIFAAERILKPNGKGIWLDFVKFHDGFNIAQCAGNEGREFIQESEIKGVFDAAGLKRTDETDHSKEFLKAYELVTGFLNDDWDSIQSKLMEWGGINAANIALEQVLVWRARASALKSGHLALKKYTFSRA